VITIRHYRETDAASVGKLIADTFSEFNLSFASPEERQLLLGPFFHARSREPAHREAIARVIQAAMVFVAEEDGDIIGVLRGRADRLQSLFVRGDHHRRGVGRMLVERFEQACLEQGSSAVRLVATLYAVPFYTRLGYKRTTGVRLGRSFGGRLKHQPMKKVLYAPSTNRFHKPR
jgi:GNAT superfamily N-acetyltransferase